MSVTCNVTCDAIHGLGDLPETQIDLTHDDGQIETLPERVKALGLRPIQAFVPDEKSKSRSKQAERTARCRAKAAADGKKNVQFMVDEATANVLREVVRIKEEYQLPAEAAVLEKFKEQYAKELAIANAVNGLTGLRRVLALWVGIPVSSRPGDCASMKAKRLSAP